MIKYPTPHKDKLMTAINNKKVPSSEIQPLKKAYKLYKKWILKIEKIYDLKNIKSDKKITLLVQDLNEYKNYIDIDLIFNSKNDFLYRQKGQMKLSSSVIEEFLPRLVHPSVIGKFDQKQIMVGPTKSLSSLQFKLNISESHSGKSLFVLFGEKN